MTQYLAAALSENAPWPKEDARSGADFQLIYAVDEGVDVQFWTSYADGTAVDSDVSVKWNHDSGWTDYTVATLTGPQGIVQLPRSIETHSNYYLAAPANASGSFVVLLAIA